MEFVRIYIPQDLLRSPSERKFFGSFYVHGKSTSFYIASEHSSVCKDIKCVGHVGPEPRNNNIQEEFFLDCIPADQTTINSPIKLRSITVNGQPVSPKAHIQVIIFDYCQILAISGIDISSQRRTFDEEFVTLLNTLQNAHRFSTSSGGLLPLKLSSKDDGKRENSIKIKREADETSGSRFAGLKSPLSAIRNTAVFQHLFARQMQLKRLDRKSICTLALDVVLGLTVILALLYAGQPYIQLTTYTEMVVIRVRSLLAALKGFPIGLKLNIELNNFFLGIFTYHINLWVTFLVLIAPVVNGLFVPFVFLGAFGFSFHLAILSDLLVFISLHAHCFYIYVAVLYHAEIEAINSLWRVLLGKRFNPLKGRVESHEYSNPQLYLATLFFAALLFLMPTVLLYYVVFSFLRFCVYCVTYVLITIQRHIMTFPVYNVVSRTFRVCVNTSNVELSLPLVDRSDPNPYFVRPVSYVQMKCHASAAEDDQMNAFANELPDMMSIFQFFMGLVKGNIMGFILPLGK